jgi:eukaryotic-like serine/threonine-protein kinase
MKKQNCPTNRLPLLIQGELSSDESGDLFSHLEDCSSCQSALEALAADATWWNRTTRSLLGVAVDDSGELPASDESACPVEALLETHQPSDPTVSMQADSAMLDAPIHPEMLGRIDEFDIEEKIGQGGMGIVFRGFERSLNRPVAVKVMSPHLGANGAARQRFVREAQAAAAVVHPHVVPIYRVNSSPERPYIVMALVDGLSLHDHVTQNGPLETKDVVRISVQIADGLAAAHRHGLIHRDIKPANILMEKDVSRVMITDFGLARAVDDVAMTNSGCLAGTPHYMSPEQVTGSEIDHRTDLFSLGSVMYFTATGREPFRAARAFAVINKVVNEAACPARSINADIPDTLDRIIGRLLEKEPSDRFQSADDLRQLLTQYLAHLQDPESHAKPQVKMPPLRKKKTLARIFCGLAAIGILLTYLLCGGFSWLGQTPEGPASNGTHSSGTAEGEQSEHAERSHEEDKHHDAHEGMTESTSPHE